MNKQIGTRASVPIEWADFETTGLNSRPGIPTRPEGSLPCLVPRRDRRPHLGVCTRRRHIASTMSHLVQNRLNVRRDMLPESRDRKIDTVVDSLAGFPREVLRCPFEPVPNTWILVLVDDRSGSARDYAVQICPVAPTARPVLHLQMVEEVTDRGASRSSSASWAGCLPVFCQAKRSRSRMVLR